jgi:hypothetical protein
MEKLIPLLLSLCLLVTPMMGKVSADDHDQVVSPEIFQQSVEQDMTFPDGSVPADSALLDGIQLPIHALVLSMIEHEENYDIQSPDFVWNALYYSLSMYGQADDRAQLTQDALLLPSESVHDFARALFAQLEALPSIPPQMTDFVRYENVTDTYRLALGDFAETQPQLGELTPQPDGTFLLDGTLTTLEDSAPLCAFQVTLLENDTMFGFSIVDVSLS